MALVTLLPRLNQCQSSGKPKRAVLRSQIPNLRLLFFSKEKSILLLDFRSPSIGLVSLSPPPPSGPSDREGGMQLQGSQSRITPLLTPTSPFSVPSRGRPSLPQDTLSDIKGCRGPRTKLNTYPSKCFEILSKV